MHTEEHEAVERAAIPLGAMSVPVSRCAACGAVWTDTAFGALTLFPPTSECGADDRVEVA